MANPHLKSYCFTDEDRRKSIETRRRNRDAATADVNGDWMDHYECEQQIRANLEIALLKHAEKLLNSKNALDLQKAVRAAAKLYGW
jgi:hypothetical protein